MTLVVWSFETETKKSPEWFQSMSLTSLECPLNEGLKLYFFVFLSYYQIIADPM